MVGVDDAYSRVLERAAEPLLALAQRLLGPLALGDVFREPGDARDVPGPVLDGEGAPADPADRAIRPHHPELPALEHAAPALLRQRDRVAPIVRMDALDPGARPLVEALPRPPPHLLVAGADVDQAIAPGIRQPEDLVDVLRHLTEALLGLAQRLLGPPALVGHEAAAGPVQGFAQAADDRT